MNWAFWQCMSCYFGLIIYYSDTIVIDYAGFENWHINFLRTKCIKKFCGYLLVRIMNILQISIINFNNIACRVRVSKCLSLDHQHCERKTYGQYHWRGTFFHCTVYANSMCLKCINASQKQCKLSILFIDEKIIFYFILANPRKSAPSIRVHFPAETYTLAGHPAQLECFAYGKYVSISKIIA